MGILTLQDLLLAIIEATKPRDQGGHGLPPQTPIYVADKQTRGGEATILQPATMALALPVAAFEGYSFGVLVQEGPAAMVLITAALDSQFRPKEVPEGEQAVDMPVEGATAPVEPDLTEGTGNVHTLQKARRGRPKKGVSNEQ